MNTFRQHIASLLLPTIVFGYAAYSNALLVLKDKKSAEAVQVEAVSISGMLDGEVTKDLDSLYKKQLPHRDVAVGYGGNARYALFGTGRKGVVVGNDGWLFTNEEFKKISETDIKNAVVKINGVKANLAAMGITLVVLPLPAKSDIYHQHVSEMLRSSDMVSAYETFMKELQLASIPVVDVKTEFMSQQQNVDVFLKSDTHWSPAGAKLAAELTGKTVGTLGVDIAAGEVNVVSSKDTTIWGDLTKFITSPDYADDIGLKPEKIELFRTEMKSAEGNLDLFGETASAPVMLVGTSYSANENWSFVDYLRQSLSVDVVNVAKEGLGPGVPMMDLLNSNTLKEAKPKLILWEFPVRYLDSKSLWERKIQQHHGHGAPTTGKDNV